MPTIGGMWISELDGDGRRCWVNSATGARSYDMISRTPAVTPRRDSMELQRYGTSPREHGNPPSLGDRGNRRCTKAQQGLAGTTPPPLSLPTSKARRHRQGKKSWVHSVTGMLTRRNPHL